MAKRIAFALLGLLCLLPAYHAAPAASSEESSKEMTLNAFLERLKLFTLTIEEFSTLYDDILDKGSKIFVEVLKDPKVTEVKTEAMESQTKILQDYLEKLEKAKKEKDKAHLFELVDEYDDVVNKFDSEQNDLTPEAAIIEKSLEENGLEDISKDIYAHFEKFMVKFNAEVDPYIKGLTEDEKKNEKKFIEWYENLQAEKDTEKKIELFDNFFDHYDN